MIETAVATRADALRKIPHVIDMAIVPGAQIAVISDAKVETRSFGVRDVQTGAPVMDETVFEGASLGKPVVAYAVLRLASAGRLDLDAPLRRYLPKLSEPVGRLTSRQLLTHTGGLPNEFGSGAFAAPVTPGQRFSYSGEGFRLLQMAIEAITGETLQEYMEQAVFEPLGMASSSFIWKPAYEQRKAFGHSFTGSSAGRTRNSEAKAASSLETTAADYAKFLLAFVQGTGLSADIARQAVQRQTGVEEGCAVCLGKPPGEPMTNVAWGLGIGLAETEAGTVAWHFGDNQTMQGYAAIALDRSRGVVVLTNSANGHSAAQRIAASLLGFEAPGYAWLGIYPPYTDPGRQALSRIVRGEVDAVAAAARTLSRPEAITLAERLLAGDRPEQAAALVRALNLPRAASEYALLAEALRQAGRLSEAREAAAEAIRLDPGNSRAMKVDKWITLAARRVPPDLLARYAGHYSSPFGPLEVTNAGGRLTARLLDQPPSAMLPLSETAFIMEKMDVPIEFVAGPDGRITHAIVRAGGEIRLPRLDR